MYHQAWVRLILTSVHRESSGGRDGARRHPRCVERGSVPRPVLGGARGVQTLGAGVQVHRPVSIWSRHHPAAPRFHACSGATRVQPACAHARQRSGADPARGAPQIATSGANSCAPLSRCPPALSRLASSSFCVAASLAAACSQSPPRGAMGTPLPVPLRRVLRFVVFVIQLPGATRARCGALNRSTGRW